MELLDRWRRASLLYQSLERMVRPRFLSAGLMMMEGSLAREQRTCLSLEGALSLKEEREISRGSNIFSTVENMEFNKGDGVWGFQEGLGCRKGEVGLRGEFLKNIFK